MSTAHDMVAEALRFLVAHQDEQPSLGRLAAHLGRSESHVQKIFQDQAGVSPKQFVRMLTRERALARLREGASVLQAALDSGLSGPGRLHDLLIDTDALTPGEARRRAQGVELWRGHGASPFGPALLAWTGRGITFLAFTRETGESSAERELARQWPDARFRDDPAGAARRLDHIFDPVRRQPLKLWLRGSPFQLKVWEALLAVPPARHVSYGQLARYIGRDNASRAVGTAIGRNPISWLIPCHRVITGSGALGGYRWGLETKSAMIGWEAAREQASEAALPTQSSAGG